MHDEVIDHIVLRPSMYFGEHEGYLRELVAMDMGYCLHSGFDEEKAQQNRPLIPRKFVKFACQRFEGGPALAWSTRIELASEGEKEAWQMFCALWQEFRTPQCQNDQPLTHTLRDTSR